MHFTSLYILKNEKLDDISRGEIEDRYTDDYCYCCGETNPYVTPYCDWFQFGGRWNDEGLVASRGIKGSSSWYNESIEVPDNVYSIVEIKDLLEPVNEVYSIIFDGEEPIEDEDKIKEILEKINSKEINGVIALIDNHD